MYVVKRDGREEPINICKIIARLKRLTYGFNVSHCDPVLVARKVCSGACNGVTTTQIDELAAEIAASMSKDHPNYALLAARIAVSNLHKNTKKSFSETIKDVYNHFNKKSGEKAYFLADDVYEIVMKNAAQLDSEIIYDTDFDYDYPSFKTIERSHLLRIDGKVVERPQHMLMRVSVGIHKDDINSALETYHLMSQRWFTHASLTLFNAETPQAQLGSCFLSIHNQQENLVPMLQLFDETASYVDQGGDKMMDFVKMMGDFAIYLEPWQADINEFLDVRKNHGKEEHRARVLFYTVWIPDLFMERVRDDGKWSLFCSNESSDLANCWGEEFEKLYTQYEEGKANKITSARKLWTEILNSQIETGTPYILFKDFCDRKSKKRHLGTTIKSSSLCAEVMECTSPTKNVVYNLATIALPQFVREKGDPPIDSQPSKLLENADTKNRYFDYDKLAKVTSIVTANMKKIFDCNRSNFQHSPIVVGVEGLAETFILLGMPFDSPEGRQLNKYIFDTIKCTNYPSFRLLD